MATRRRSHWAYSVRAHFAMGMAFARQAIDLYMELAAEEANPVPVDDLTLGRVALSVRRRTRRRCEVYHPI